MPTVNLSYAGSTYQTLFPSPNRDGIVELTSNSANHVYIYDPASGRDWKLVRFATIQIAVVKDAVYPTMVMGDVSITWTLL